MLYFSARCWPSERKGSQQVDKDLPNSKFVDYDLSDEAIKEASIDTKSMQINIAVFKAKISKQLNLQKNSIYHHI
jgi:hypothetical protein